MRHSRLIRPQLRAACALTMCVCLASACGSGAAETVGVRTFRSSTYRYSIEYPADWSALQADRQLDDGEPPGTGPGGTDILARRADRRVRDMQLPAVVVGAQPVTTQTNLDDWTSTVIGLVAQMKGCERPAARSHVWVGGDEAVVLAYPNCPADPSLYHLWTVLVHGGRGYQIVWFNAHGREQRDRALLDKMLASVSFAD